MTFGMVAAKGARVEVRAAYKDDAAAAEEHMRQSLLLGPGQPGPAGAVAHLWDDKK